MTSKASVLLPEKDIGIRIAGVLKKNKEPLLDEMFNNQFDAEILERHGGVSGLERIDRKWLKETYLGPQIELLIHFFAHQDERTFFLYLNERSRFRPHDESADSESAFHREVTPRDENSFKSVLDPELRDEFLRIIAAGHRRLCESIQDSPMKVLMVGDCIMNEVQAFLPWYSDTPVETYYDYFDVSKGGKIQVKSLRTHLEKTKIEAIVCSVFSFEAIPLFPFVLNECKSIWPKMGHLNHRVEQLMRFLDQFIDGVREQTSIPIYLHNVSGVPLTLLRRRLGIISDFSFNKAYLMKKLNERIRQRAVATENVFIIDENRIAKEMGRKEASEKIVTAEQTGQGLYTAYNLIPNVAKDLARRLQVQNQFKKTKLLLIDFDHTLWDGVMAEGEVRQYPDRQKLLKELKESGIVLVAVSKNDPKNIRWNEMILKEEDFALSKIGWGLKAASIKETAEELNLGLNSFVFIDDNPAERELVRKECPAVLCLDALDPSTWEKLEALLHLPNTKQTEEAKRRTQMYREQAERSQSLKKTKMDYPAMMKSLGLKAALRNAEEKDVPRLSELFGRTNQFNTTTIRYTETDIRKMMASSEYELYVGELGDKFGDLGIVLACSVHRQKDYAQIECFVMSCRAMGFEFENWTLRQIMNRLAKNTGVLKGAWKATDRNAPSADLFENNGFKKQSDTEWMFEASNGQIPPMPQWFS